MNEGTKITGWWSFLKAVVFKPTWEFYTTGILFTFLAMGTWWRDSFFSPKWQKRLDLKGLLPSWHPAWWVCIGLLVEILLVVRESYRLWLIQRTRVSELEGLLNSSRQRDFPKVIISYKDHDADDEWAAAGASIGNFASVKNVSPEQTVFNVSVLPLETPDGRATFAPDIIGHIGPGSAIDVQPCIEGASPQWMHSIGHLLSRSYKDTSKDSSLDEFYEQKPFAFRVQYDDGANNRFEAECTLLYTKNRHQVSMGEVSYKRLT